MQHSFLGKSFLFKCFLLLFLSLFISSLKLFMLGVVFLASSLALFRKNKINPNNILSSSTEILLSPVNGEVIKIFNGVKKNKISYRVILIKVPLLGPYGVFLPNTSSVSLTEKIKGYSLFDYRKSADFTNSAKQYNLHIQNKHKNNIVLQVLGSPFRPSFRTWVKPGDKGRTGSCVGYMPLGGSLAIYLEEDSKVDVIKGSKIIAGKTVLAGFKG